ncbi:PF20097 family protein [Konateibacter massiliensis]|uniref:PF20097 family protein n=1 Tax=Konateibacter massiliensis TaxID=2002841 RepID=UPI000C146C7B|nr:PF20097 family protein [Konateibacter massiliensis]
MKCPYCSKEMEEGYIPSDRYSLKWINKNKKSKWPLLNEKIKLTSILTEPYVEAFHCSECEKIIIDLKNIVL